MKFVNEYRDPELGKKLIERIHRHSTRPTRLMEFCGGHTVAIFKHGLRQLLPKNIEMLSGPGCPVCVTANADLDRAIALARLPDVIISSFGDMVRVPGSYSSLQRAKANGADVRIVYSVQDALAIARDNPGKSVVFIGIGFETTAPTIAASILQAEREEINNYYVLSLHKLCPPIMKALLDLGEVRLDGIICPGHVSSIIGSHPYQFIPDDYHIACAISGFEPLDILLAIDMLVNQIETGQPKIEIAYRRGVKPEGNQQAVAHYVKALEIRRIGHEAVSIFGGKIPHGVGVVPGGVTSVPTVDNIMAYIWKIKILQDFINNVYIPDVLAVAGAYLDYAEIGAGCKNLLAYGSFDLDGNSSDYTRRERLFKQGTVSADLKPADIDTDKITEYVRHSWYEDATSGRHPSQGETKPQYGKKGAYSWTKAPRYDGKVYEVGPLARVAVTYARGDPVMKELVDGALNQLKASPAVLFSVLGRHLARALSAKYIADSLEGWALALKPGEPTYVEYEIPDEAMGMGLTDAARGALGHWIEIKDKKIANYQCVVPTTWNISPMDDEGQHGPIEQALIGTKVKDESNPFEIVRIIRSFDPCLACSIHMVTPKGRDLGQYRIV